MNKYGIQSGLFSDAIHIGELNKTGTAFTSKEDCTNQALAAVIEYTARHHGGKLSIQYQDGTEVTITIKKEAHND